MTSIPPRKHQKTFSAIWVNQFNQICSVFEVRFINELLVKICISEDRNFKCWTKRKIHLGFTWVLWCNRVHTELFDMLILIRLWLCSLPKWNHYFHRLGFTLFDIHSWFSSPDFDISSSSLCFCGLKHTPLRMLFWLVLSFTF